MQDHWVPVIERDVDGVNSLPLALDRENPTLGRYSTCRRVSRTIYMGSAPVQHTANRGIDERQVKLGCVQPGEAVATFGDAIRRLTNRATYLYVDGKRYWYSTQPTVTRLAEDRAGQLRDDDVEEEIKKRLSQEARSKGDFRKVHACREGADIVDEREAALVILGPEFPHRSKDAGSAARKEAASILESRGNSPRNYRNALVFLAPDVNRLRELEDAVRQYLAWTSIWEEREALNLDPFQAKQAETKRKGADDTVKGRIPETYQWLLAPGLLNQDPKGEVEWSEYKLTGQDTLAVRASKRLKTEGVLMVEMGGLNLKLELDRVPLWRGNHVGLKQLCEDFARYLYLPRLQDEKVLLDAVRDGVERLTWGSETFAYAEKHDEAKGRYIGLRAGKTTRIVVDDDSVLVKPEAAAAQIAADDAKAATQTGATSAPAGSPAAGAALASGSAIPTSEPGVSSTQPKRVLNRFHGSVSLDPIRLGRDASRIAEEVVQHLTGIVGANIEVTLEIHAELPDGASEKLVRDVTENCRTLKFTNYGFEES
jgi:hypothetical protein